MSNEGTKEQPITEEDVARVLGEGCNPESPKQPAGEETPSEATAKPGAKPGAKPEEGQDAAPGAQEPEFEDESDSRVAALEAEVAQLKEQLLRAFAEGENLRKRFTRERDEQAKYALSPLAKDLLPVADNLRRALESIPPEAIGDDERLKGIMAGVEMTEKALLDAFGKHHIVRLDPKGEKLDPHRHEAMVEIPDGETPAGHIAQVFEKGYMLHERLLRPARVAVSKGAPQQAPQPKANAAGSGDAEPPAPGAKIDTKV